MDAGHFIFFALLLVAEILGAIGGFGSSMLVMPLAGLFLPFDQAYSTFPCVQQRHQNDPLQEGGLAPAGAVVGYPGGDRCDHRCPPHGLP